MASVRCLLCGGAGVVFLLCLLMSGLSAAAAASHLDVPLEPAAQRARRAADVQLECADSPEICDIYSRAFQSLPGQRTAGEPTLRGVSRDTCAARCALRAPACRHFSYQPQQRLCILGCRPGSSGCAPSGDLMKDEAWTFHFLSAHRLASISNSIILALQSRAAAAGTQLQNVTAQLQAGRFGGRELSVGAEPAIEALFGAPGRGPAGGAVADMIANGRHDHTHLLPLDCGRVPLSGQPAQPVPSILGGEPAYPGQYPWQARILISQGGSYVHRCGGTIISDRHVLTAAHCLRDVPFTQVEVRVGETDFDDLSFFSIPRQIFRLINVKFHNRYLSALAGGTFAYDIMILQIRPNNDKLIQFNELVQPACVPRAGLEYPGLEGSEMSLRCNVSGWGKTSNEATITSKILRGVEVPLVSNSYCSSSEVFGRRFQPSIMFCAGFTDEGVNRDSCGGDSGGPLACPLQDSNLFAVYGVVSHSHPKGCGREPGVYTKVSNFTDWILDTVRSLV